MAKSDLELAGAANENFVASYEKLVAHSPDGETRRFGSVLAFASGLPVALFNGCVVVDAATAQELHAAISWVRARGLPHRVWIAPDVAAPVADVPSAFGLARETEPYPGMALHPFSAAPPPAPGVRVEPVSESSLDEYLGVCVEGGMPSDMARRLFSPALAFDPDVLLFVGRLEGRPVGTAMALRSEAASGVYAVGTLPAARRRGVGSALTWAAAEAGRSWGRDTIVLQSSAMAVSMYAAMGFRTVVPYWTFGDPASR